METNSPSNPKKDRVQKTNEGFSGDNLPKDYNPAATKLKQELEAHRQLEKKPSKENQNR
ncbi:hypothetical protein [Flavobacterium sp.]|uniref:hypothetical protein n=1 Tax=Flavobacterium sp. TaxID=239 RepID=UPI0039E38232